MKRYAMWVGALLVALAAGVAGGTGTRVDDTPFFVGYPSAPKPGDDVWVEGYPSLPYSQADVYVYLRGPRAGGGVEVRLPSAMHYYPDRFVAIFSNLTTEGRYFFEYYQAPFKVGDVPDADYEFSVSANGTLTAVEYFNKSLGHYFVTASPAEIASLDAGTPPGWTRTGEHFTVLAVDAMPSYAAPVCRYYGLPSAGLDTHFLSDDPAECAAIPRLWPDQWVLETTGAFAVPQGYPFNTFSACGEDLTDDYNPRRALYRLYNNRRDANHRYTTSPQIRDQMIRAGWVLEGRYPADGSNVYAMCVWK